MYAQSVPQLKQLCVADCLGAGCWIMLDRV